MAQWIKTTSQVETVTPKNGRIFTLEELQHFVGGYIEALDLGDGSIMYLNEDGKREELPYNLVADLIAHVRTGIAFTDSIVGDVLIATKTETGDDEDE